MTEKLKPCPFDKEGDRKYYLLAGGKIELQERAGGIHRSYLGQDR